MNLIAFMNRADVFTEDERNSFKPFWLRLIALCGPYAEAFGEAMLEGATRSIAKDIFSPIIKAFNPFPYVFAWPRS
jgi:hypothetical protein